MTDFSTSRPNESTYDSGKHVNFVHGMVLGVDDFKQEFAYLNGRDQLMARGLLGYGTVCGLRISLEFGTDGITDPRLAVAPGLALTPQGQFVRIRAEQCAHLNVWLNSPEIKEQLQDAANGRLEVHVVLCYRECLSDDVPIPGEPCRTEQDALQPSRITDDFHLELRFVAPEQSEENAVRNLLAWVRQIEVKDAPNPPNLTDLLTALRGTEFNPHERNQALQQALTNAVAAGTLSNTSTTVDALKALEQAVLPSRTLERAKTIIAALAATTTLPEIRISLERSLNALAQPAAALFVTPAGLPEFLHEAYRVWVTEVRPSVLGTGQTCAGTPPNEGCLLLAHLTVPFITDAAGKRVVSLPASDGTQRIIDEHDRPYVLSLRLIQEWLLTHSNANIIELKGEVVGPSDATRVNKLLGLDLRPAETLEDGMVLTVQTATGGARVWRPVPPTNIAQLPLAGDVAGPNGSNKISNLQSIPVDAFPVAPGQVLTVVQTDDGTFKWKPESPNVSVIPNADGDVVGPIAATTVTKIQRVPVAPQAAGELPGVGQVLTFNGTVWAPATLPTPQGAQGDFVQVLGDRVKSYGIVAAGVISVNPELNRKPNYNKLTLNFGDVEGQVLVQFASYDFAPVKAEETLYIVKAIGFGPFRLEQQSQIVIHVEGFIEQGILLRIFVNGKLADQGTLKEMGLTLMLEISQFPILVDRGLTPRDPDVINPVNNVVTPRPRNRKRGPK